MWTLQDAQPDKREALTKAIVFSHLWTHTLLIEAQLRAHGVIVALFKSSMKPEDKAAGLQAFKVHVTLDAAGKSITVSRLLTFFASMGPDSALKFILSICCRRMTSAACS